MFPGDLHTLGSSLDKLRELIRSRYFIAYKPANFQPNGSYRTISCHRREERQTFASPGSQGLPRPPGGQPQLSGKREASSTRSISITAIHWPGRCSENTMWPPRICATAAGGRSR